MNIILKISRKLIRDIVQVLVHINPVNVWCGAGPDVGSPGGEHQTVQRLFIVL